MPRVVHFEINADQPERASKFYSTVFGWEIKKWEGPMDYWLVTTGTDGQGINGALMNRTHPGATTVNTVDVPSVDDYVQKITANGGKLVIAQGPRSRPSGISPTARTPKATLSGSSSSIRPRSKKDRRRLARNCHVIRVPA